MKKDHFQLKHYTGSAKSQPFIVEAVTYKDGKGEAIVEQVGAFATREEAIESQTACEREAGLGTKRTAKPAAEKHTLSKDDGPTVAGEIEPEPKNAAAKSPPRKPAKRKNRMPKVGK